MYISTPLWVSFFSYFIFFPDADASLLTLIFLLMVAIGGSTGISIGNSVSDISIRGTYYDVAHFHVALCLAGVSSIFPGIMRFRGKYQESLHQPRRARDIILLRVRIVLAPPDAFPRS